MAGPVALRHEVAEVLTEVEAVANATGVEAAGRVTAFGAAWNVTPKAAAARGPPARNVIWITEPVGARETGRTIPPDGYMLVGHPGVDGA